MVSDEQIVVRLRQLLTEVDIATATGSHCCCRHIVEVISCVHIAGGEQLTTRLAVALAERQLRKSLEAEFGEDLSNRKAVVREEVQNAPLPPSPLSQHRCLERKILCSLCHSPLSVPRSLPTERAFCS